MMRSPRSLCARITALIMMGCLREYPTRGMSRRAAVEIIIEEAGTRTMKMSMIKLKIMIKLLIK